MPNDIKTQRETLVKTAILDAAETLIKTKGFSAVNIREIAKNIGYSPGNIYKYYENKQAIINAVIERGYIQLMTEIRMDRQTIKNPIERIIATFTTYINHVLKDPIFYRAVMLDKRKDTIEKTGVLNQEAIIKRPQFITLINTIKEAQSHKQLNPKLNPVIIAQTLWTATYGLLMRLIIEGPIDQETKNSLLEHHFTLLLKS
ncbi:MAG: TetR/AcrR family transcriptional regulator [Bacillota bacterium]